MEKEELKGFLRTSEVVKLLEERGLKITARTLRRYVQRKLIPKEMVKIEQRGLNVYYFFKPDVVNYLVSKIPRKDFQN